MQTASRVAAESATYSASVLDIETVARHFAEKGWPLSPPENSLFPHNGKHAIQEPDRAVTSSRLSVNTRTAGPEQ
jgi:hypothetical protein